MIDLNINVLSVDDEELRSRITSKLNDLTKPLGSLGMLEDIVMQYALCKGDEMVSISTKELSVFAGDHGITAEGVSPFPSEVTVQMVQNMLSGGAAVTVMCGNASIPYRIVDMGVNATFDDHDLLVKTKIAYGTKSFLNDAAMSYEQCLAALKAGIDLVDKTMVDIVAIGEMGIGNTSSASALYALLLNQNAADTVGMGTGSVGELLHRKKQVIESAVAYHRKSWDGSAIDALRRVGGFEIAGMTGYILGCADKRIPIVVDGFIATAAALSAIKIIPEVKDYLFFGHVSDEKFHRSVLSELGVVPILQLGMRLGEGSGAVLALQIIEQALNCYNNMATFSSAGVSNKDV